MTIQQLLTQLNDSKILAAAITAILSSGLGAFFGLHTYRQQAKELVDGAIAWHWTHSHEGTQEEPFLVMQNRSSVPAYIISAQYRRGVFLRVEDQRYAFSYSDPVDGNFPLEVKAQGVTSFPLSMQAADRMAAKAGLLSVALAYLFKRPYLWIEIGTLSRRRLMIPANDVTSFSDRALWLEGRWTPKPKPEWLKNAGQAKVKKGSP